MHTYSSCRICLREGNGNYKSVFYSENSLSYAQKIEMVCSSVEISPDDGFPSSICDICVLNLSKAHAFKQLCEGTNQKLQSERTIKIFMDQEFKIEDIKQEDMNAENENNSNKDILCGEDIAENIDDPIDDSETFFLLDVSENPEVPIKARGRRRAEARRSQYWCDICGKSSVRKCDLIIHMRTHTGEKPYQCPSKDFLFLSACGHNSDKLMCAKITINDAKEFRESFYKESSKISQCLFLLKCCETKKTARRRPRSGTRKPLETYTKWYVNKHDSMERLPVCKKVFMSILNISKHTLLRVSKTYHNTGCLAIDKRGGDRKTKLFLPKLNAVKQFLELYKNILPFDYGSAPSSKKIMQVKPSVSTLWKLFQSKQTDEQLKVKLNYFRRVFNQNYQTESKKCEIKQEFNKCETNKMKHV